MKNAITERDIYLGFVGSDLSHVNGGIGWTAADVGKYGARVVTLAELSGVLRRDALNAATKWVSAQIKAASQLGVSDYHGVPYPGAAQDALRMLRRATKDARQ